MQLPGETLHVQSEILGEERFINVCLPWGYQDSDAVYPVLILLDGETITACSHAQSTMEILDGKGLAPQLIIAGIDSGTGVRDYFPQPVPGRPESGEAGKFLRFLTLEVMPLISTRYRTAPFTILYGASNAGMFTVFAMMEDPGAFSAFIAASPSLGWFPDYFRERFSVFSPGEGVRFYMNRGTDDIERIVIAQAESLAEAAGSAFGNGDPFVCEVIPDGGHVPYISLYNGLCHVFNGFRLSDVEAAEQGLQGITDHYSGLSERYGYAIVPPGRVFMAAGRNRLQSGNATEAVEVFQAYLDYYPMSAMAHYFLGESFLAAEDSVLAAVSFRRTLEVEPGFGPALRKLEILEEN